jgi:hypothetical protein
MHDKSVFGYARLSCSPISFGDKQSEPKTLYLTREPKTLYLTREPKTLYLTREPKTLYLTREPKTLYQTLSFG